MLTNAPRSQGEGIIAGPAPATMERSGFARLACWIGKSPPHDRQSRAYHLNELCVVGVPGLGDGAAIRRGRGSALSA